MLESSEDYITAELEKQKRKLRDISLVLEQQHTLVRLIVQVCFFQVVLFRLPVAEYLNGSLLFDQWEFSMSDLRIPNLLNNNYT